MLICANNECIYICQFDIRYILMKNTCMISSDRYLFIILVENYSANESIAPVVFEETTVKT